MAPAVRAFRGTSRLLVQVGPEAPDTGSGPRERLVTLYNLSPFSTELSLPDYVRSAEQDAGTDGAAPHLLAPSQLFLSLVPHYGADATGEVADSLQDWALNPAVARRLLALEGVRFRSREGERTRFAPLRRVMVPANRIGDFLDWLETRSAAGPAGVRPLPPPRLVESEGTQRGGQDQTLDLGETPETWGLFQVGLEDPDLLVYLMEAAKTERGTRFTYLISNLSSRPIELDLAGLAIVEVGRGKVRSQLNCFW